MKRIALAILFISTTTLAEYRVYQYVVTNKVLSTNEKPNSFTVKSTMSPTMYIAYHGGSELINIDLVRTRRCVGNTAKKNLCPSPYAKLNLGDLNENR